MDDDRKWLGSDDIVEAYAICKKESCPPGFVTYDNKCFKLLITEVGLDW